MSTTYKGLFIAFEGGEGSGKSTQARMLAEALESHDIRAYLTHEPGDTLLGKHLRGLLLHQNAGAITQKAEALLFAADRAQHVETVIRPNLDEGQVVVCDRYIASTMAYQVYGNGLDATQVACMSQWASEDLYPDITFLLDVDPVIGLERVDTGSRNKFEAEDLIFHNKVRQGFLEQKTDSWVVLPANLSVEELHDKILDHTLHVLSVLQRFRAGVMTDAEVREDKGAYSLRVVCTKADCQNPAHAYGHAADDPSDTYESSLAKMERMTAALSGSPTTHPLTDAEDLSDMAQQLAKPRVGACGFDDCIEHPPILKVIK